MRCPYCDGTGEISLEKMSVNGAIEHYYRSKAAGGKITLRQVAAQTGYSYGYLRQCKMAYDAAGKWGCKKR